MTKSPCIGCELEAADKNNATCRECNKRVEYVALIEDGGEWQAKARPVQTKRQYHKTTIEAKKINNNKGCLIKGCGETVCCRGLCLRKHYQQWHKGYIEHPVLGKYKVAQPKKNSLARNALACEAGGIKEDKKEQTRNNKDKTGNKGTENMKNKLIDLNNYIFAQLERLVDEDLKGEKLIEEIQRSSAITSLAGQIISNAGLALKAQVAVNDLLLKNPPKMLGIEGFDAER